jgi:hypothetical protein
VVVKRGFWRQQHIGRVPFSPRKWPLYAVGLWSSPRPPRIGPKSINKSRTDHGEPELDYSCNWRRKLKTASTEELREGRKSQGEQGTA